MNSKFNETVTIYEIFIQNPIYRDKGLFIYLSPNYNCYIQSNMDIILFSFQKLHKYGKRIRSLSSSGVDIDQMEVKREIWHEFFKLARHFGAVEIEHEDGGE